MRKTFIAIVTIGVSLLLAIAVYASVSVTLSVPNGYAQRVLDACTAGAGKKIEITIEGEDYAGHKSFTYTPQDPNETNKEFVKRVVKTTMKAFIWAKEKADADAYVTQQYQNIEIPEVNVPEDIIE